VQVCGLNDVGCTAALQGGQTGVNGVVTLDLPTINSALSGYLKMTSPDTVPSYVYWGFPISQARFVVGTNASAGSSVNPVLLDPVASFQSYSQIIAAQLDGGLGVTPLGVNVRDCLHMPAGGVEVTLNPVDPQTVAFNPSASLVRGPPVTDTDGALLFVNAPEGTVTVTATAVGKTVGSVTATVRDGGVTVVDIGPTPQ
jgi:hypothetical protein